MDEHLNDDFGDDEFSFSSNLRVDLVLYGDDNGEGFKSSFFLISFKRIDLLLVKTIFNLNKIINKKIKLILVAHLFHSVSLSLFKLAHTLSVDHTRSWPKSFLVFYFVLFSLPLFHSLNTISRSILFFSFTYFIRFLSLALVLFILTHSFFFTHFYFSLLLFQSFPIFRTPSLYVFSFISFVLYLSLPHVLSLHLSF